MQGFLESIVAFPTVVFTVLMGIALLFWAVSMLGGIDLDGFDVDLDADIDLDGDADGGAAHTGLLDTLGLAGVPISIAATALVFFAWVISFVASSWLLPLVGGGVVGTLATVGIGIGSFLLAIPPAAICMRPLRGAFTTHRAVRKRTLVGSICTITTQRVTDTYGQAEIRDGGAGLLMQVRCREGVTLSRDDTAVVCEYDAEEDIYVIAPADQLSAADVVNSGHEATSRDSGSAHNER